MFKWKLLISGNQVYKACCLAKSFRFDIRIGGARCLVDQEAWCVDVLFTDRLANALGNFNNPCSDLSTELKKKRLDS